MRKNNSSGIIDMLYDRKHPALFFHLMKILAVLTLPILFFIKVVEEGIYEVDILDKDKKVFRKGYIWCNTHEYRYSRLKRVKKDIKLRNKTEGFMLPSRYSIYFKKVCSGIDHHDIFIWADSTFKLHDIPSITVDKIAISYPERILSNIKGFINKKSYSLPLSIILVETELLNKRDELLAKSYMFADDGNAAYKTMKEELKQNPIKDEVKYVKMKYYKKETPCVIWEET
jgi:hypothetical protein